MFFGWRKAFISDVPATLEDIEFPVYAYYHAYLLEFHSFLKYFENAVFKELFPPYEDVDIDVLREELELRKANPDFEPAWLKSFPHVPLKEGVSLEIQEPPKWDAGLYEEEQKPKAIDWTSKYSGGDLYNRKRNELELLEIINAKGLTPESLQVMFRAILNFYESAVPGQKDTWPKQDEVIKWLVEHGIAKTNADPIARLIRPANAPKGRYAK